MGEIQPKRCEGRELTKDQLAGRHQPPLQQPRCANPPSPLFRLRVATAVGLWLSHGCAEYEMKEMEARIMDAIAGKRKSKKQSTDLSDGAE